MSSPLHVSNDGIVLIQYFEQCRLKAYPDPGTGGEPWTVGWGHTGPDVHKGLRISQKRADDLLREDLGDFERDVARLVEAYLEQWEFDALVSFAFNVGADIDSDDIAEGLGDSTLLRMLNAGDRVGAANQFLHWNRSGGKEMLGLKRRRAAERSMFLGADVASAIAVGKAVMS